jgi:hypothetical protein
MNENQPIPAEDKKEENEVAAPQLTDSFVSHSSFDDDLDIGSDLDDEDAR